MVAARQVDRSLGSEDFSRFVVDCWLTKRSYLVYYYYYELKYVCEMPGGLQWGV